jgi:hypothetical protein
LEGIYEAFLETTTTMGEGGSEKLLYVGYEEADRRGEEMVSVGVEDSLLESF